MKKQLVIAQILGLLLFFSIISTTAVSDDSSISLTASYGGNGSDIAFQGIQTSDEGYVIIGTTDSFGNGGFDYWLIKTDQNGITEWNMFYGGAGDDAAYSVVQTDDEGYALAGYSNSFGNNDFDFLLIKTNIIGEVEWHKTYGGTAEDRATWLIKTIDGGYALGGYTNSFSDNDYDFLLVKTDENGDIQWYNTYGDYNSDKASYLIQSDDGGFLIVGETNSFGTGDYDFWVVKTDCNGSMEWNRTYGGLNMDHAQAVVQVDHGGFLIVGETNSFGSGNYDFWVVKIDCNGSMEWNRTYGWKEMDHAQSVIQSDDGGFLIAGYSEQFLYYNFQIFKTDERGYLQWEKNYSGNADIFAQSIFVTMDKECLLTGFVLLENPNFDFLMLKTNISNFSKTNLYPSSSNPPFPDVLESRDFSEKGKHRGQL